EAPPRPSSRALPVPRPLRPRIETGPPPVPMWNPARALRIRGLTALYHSGGALSDFQQLAAINLGDSTPQGEPMAELSAIILAAGEGTRMRSALPKVLHPVGGLPIVGHVVRAAYGAGATRVGVVVGPGHDSVRAAV